jgi:hypothetical protein
MYNLKALLSPLVLSLAACVSPFPTNGEDLALSKRATVEQNVFFDINSTEAEKKIAQLKAEGYRPTSLSVHGSPTDAKYAGIWTKEDGNTYETILGADENTYNAWLDSGIAKGLVSTHVSATGSASNAVFAGVMQQFSPIVSWVQRCGLDDPNAYLNATGDMQMLIKGVSMYGVPGQRQYCILGHENTVNSQQTVWYQTDSNMNDYKTLLASETSKKYWRPVYIDISGDHVLSPIFDDTTVGQWTSLTDLTTSQLESEVAAKREKNMYPTHLSSGGDTEAKYAVIFAERTTPLSREWHTTGSVTGFTDNAGVTDAMDQVMQGFMKRNSVRQAQVAASVNGKVVASRSYTTTHLVDAGLLNLTTKVYPLLGYNNPADERSLDITVQQLMEHTAGFDRSKSGDIGFIFTDVAKSLNQATPVTLRQMIEYIVARPLDFTPGTQQAYSNYGTMLLSYVVANLTGETYMSYLEKNVLEGADVDLWATAAEFHKNDAIVQESKSTGISALTPLSATRVSATEGGDGAVKEEAIGSFALRASAETISQFIGKHNPLGYGGRVPYAFKDGSLAGARSMAYSMTDLDFAIILNTSEYGDQAEWTNLVFNDIQSVWYRYELAK